MAQIHPTSLLLALIALGGVSAPLGLLVVGPLGRRKARLRRCLKAVYAKYEQDTPQIQSLAS